MKNAKETVLAMFTEPVSKHFLDSGSAYGYTYEENKQRDFLNEPLVTVDDWGVHVNTARYLIEEIRLDFDDVTDIVNEVIKENGWHWIVDVGLDILGGGHDFLGELNNSYNYDSFLDNVILYRYFKYDGNTYVLLQVHGGCDVRGGYTDVKCFSTEYYIETLPRVAGMIGDRGVSNIYDGFNLRFDDTDEELTEEEMLQVEEVYLIEIY